jgi:HSP20 family protein
LRVRKGLPGCHLTEYQPNNFEEGGSPMMTTTWNAIPTLDRVFDEVLRSSLRGKVSAGTLDVAADIRETDDAYIFQFDVPGVKSEDLDITFADRVLAVQGVRRFGGRDNEKSARDRSHKRFALSYGLPDNVDGDKLSADLADGVLTIRIPKHPKAQPRKIPIGRGSDRNQIVG